MMGLGMPPAALSMPFLLRTTLIDGILLAIQNAL